MNRKLKFRAWDGKRFNTKDVYIKQNGSTYDYEEDYGGTFSSNEKLEQYKCIVQQFTGRKDKNGKEIYEGDIVLDRVDANVLNKEMSIFVVSYDETYSAFILKHKDGRSWNWIRNVSSHGEVIGDILTTPKLIK